MQKLVFKGLLALTGVTALVSSKVALSQTQITSGVTSAKATPPATTEEIIIPREMAIIFNTGSTHTIGYRIFLLPSGQARYVYGSGRGDGKISQVLTKKFFRDIRAAMALEKFPTKQPCIKPVSFSTSTTIRFNRKQSPDISCSGNAKVRLLFNDVKEIAQTLKVKNVPRSQGNELPPWHL